MALTKTPVLFITFARPEYARPAFNQIKLAKPQKLYFYSNKARTDNPDEVMRNNTIRSFINEIDWDCDLITFFRDEYVDIYTSLFGAIDWVFANEEQAIILEEDCVASTAFFDYCDKLLPLYAEDPRIWLLSGNNFFEGFNPNGYDYIFSRYPYQYGWASWRKIWQTVDRNNIRWQEMKEYEIMRQLFPDKKEAEFHIKYSDFIISRLKAQPAWDLIFGFSGKSQGGFGIVPVVNLVSNIGVKGAHNSGYNKWLHNKSISDLNAYSIINPPPFVVPDYKYDRYFFNRFHYRPSLIHHRIIQKAKRIIPKLKELISNYRSK
jgi:hypothetical protein